MIYDIKEADLSLLQRFYDMANCADASYARGLKWIEDNSAIGYTYTDSTTGQTYLTTYARAIEANFNTDKVVGEHCFPLPSNFTIEGWHWCKTTTLNNDIDNISKNSPASSLSLRTKEFVSNFEILKHCPNTSNGFSATLFKDVRSDELIFAIRGTEPLSNLMVDILFDIGLFSKEVPSLQYLDMLTFYEECLQAYPKMRESFVIVGHSLGGCLAQLLALSIATPSTCNNLKEVLYLQLPWSKRIETPFCYHGRKQ